MDRRTRTLLLPRRAHARTTAAAAGRIQGVGLARVLTTLAFAIVTFVGTARSDDDLDRVMVAGDRIVMEIGAGDVRTVAVGAVRGSRLSVSAKAMRRSTVEPGLAVATPDGTARDLGGRLKLSKRSARVKGLPIDSDGEWRVTLTGVSGGGGVSLSIAGTPPMKFKWKGDVADAAAIALHEFVALPGSTVTLKVRGQGAPAWIPQFDVLTPFGDVLVPAAGKSRPPTLVVDELGAYVLRIYGGPGTYTAQVQVRPPRVKGRYLTYSAVEALPRLDGVVPASVRNDDTHVLTLTGIGISGSVRVGVSSPTRGYASAPVSGLTADGGTATIDLTGVPPGSYRIGLTTSVGNTVYAEAPFVVTDRIPSVALYSTPEFASYDPVYLRINGYGFDPDCEVEVTRSADGLDCPLAVLAREGHTILDLVVWPWEYAVGKYDVTLRDPSGGSRTYAEALDVFGYAGPPAVLVEHDSAVVWGSDLYPVDAAYDATSNRVLAAVVDDDAAEFILFDLDAMEVLQTYRVWVLSSRHSRPRVAWSAQDGTFAMTWIRRANSGNETGWVRVCSADDLSEELSLTQVASGDLVTQVDAAADAALGGYMVVWQRYSPTPGSSVYSQRFTPDGAPDPDTKTLIYDHELGLAFTTSVVQRSDGRFVVAHVGATDGLTAFALRRIVLAGDGSITSGSEIVTTSEEWYGLYQPELAADPDDGSVLVGFTYRLSDRYRPGVVRLSGNQSRPDDVQSSDGDGVTPEGVLERIVWNPARSEYVIGLTRLTGARAVIRRVARDGRIKIAYWDESYDGGYAIPWSGPAPGQMGWLRLDDGLENGVTNFAGPERITAAPAR